MPLPDFTKPLPKTYNPVRDGDDVRIETSTFPLSEVRVEAHNEAGDPIDDWRLGRAHHMVVHAPGINPVAVRRAWIELAHYADANDVMVVVEYVVYQDGEHFKIPEQHQGRGKPL